MESVLLLGNRDDSAVDDLDLHRLVALEVLKAITPESTVRGLQGGLLEGIWESVAQEPEPLHS
jgi:hypothetical protein